MDIEKLDENQKKSLLEYMESSDDDRDFKKVNSLK